MIGSFLVGSSVLGCSILAVGFLVWEILGRSDQSLLQDRFRGELSRLETWEQRMILATLERIASMMGATSIDASPYLVSGSVGFRGDPQLEHEPSPQPGDHEQEAR